MNTKKILKYLKFWRAVDTYRDKTLIISRVDKQAEAILAENTRQHCKRVAELADNKAFLDMVDLLKVDMNLREEDSKHFPSRLISLVMSMKKKCV